MPQFHNVGNKPAAKVVQRSVTRSAPSVGWDDVPRSHGWPDMEMSRSLSSDNTIVTGIHPCVTPPPFPCVFYSPVSGFLWAHHHCHLPVCDLPSCDRHPGFSLKVTPESSIHPPRASRAYRHNIEHSDTMTNKNSFLEIPSFHVRILQRKIREVLFFLKH